ncbi:Luciferin 4-monooxygenase [Pseudolycoriella hygida]|uniref:Luciferin 4-monooxygenase n=1 Tax=Pseudolycoriella hygida TaxID=35572 RepID=A0A9Q0MJ99_9DIPT|nr:Luciferin 4-monooxygenase [Pseudolycoriella hygida]
MMIDGISGETLSAIQVLNRSIEVSKALLKAGIRPGDIVSIISENRFEYVYIFFGTIFVNCAVAPLNPTYNEKELEHAINLTKPKFVFASDATIEKVSNVTRSLSYVKQLIRIGNGAAAKHVLPWNDFLNPQSIKNVKFEPKPVDKSKTICVLVCSSGTTGLAKGVQLSQDNIVVAIRHAFVSKKTDLDYDVVILGLLPLYHIYGCEVLTCVMATVPGRIILLQNFEEKNFLSSIEKYRCTHLFLVPPLMVFLSKHPNVDKYDLSSIRVIHSGAAPLSKETEDAVKHRLKNPNLEINQGYGMSELTSGVLSQKTVVKPGSVGDVNLGVFVKVIDEKGNAVGPNQTGELCFKGKRVMAGYIDNKQATSAMIDDDGWLHTGDIGYYDKDFQFYIVDRIKELIKWKGFQVAPAEIEALLLTHPKIIDCGVIGKPDEVAGELAMAFVVRADESLTENDVVEFVNKNSSPAKKLRGGVIFIAAIPKSPAGKILRRDLRELLKKTLIKSKL